MQSRDILWAVSIPFRMYNKKKLDLNTLAFTLSFDAALCDVSTALKIITVALEKGWIERTKEEDKFLAKFEFWKPRFLSPSWRPDFSGLEDVPTQKLSPLDKTIEYKPIIENILKKPVSTEINLFNMPKVVNIEKEEENSVEKREKEKNSEKEAPKKKTEVSSTKSKEKSKKKQKGQKSIQDFFK